jgi:hypothetical protein
MSHRVQGMGILREEFGGVSKGKHHGGSGDVSHVLDLGYRKKFLWISYVLLAMEFRRKGRFQLEESRWRAEYPCLIWLSLW